jgi:hypothetical protein
MKIKLIYGKISAIEKGLHDRIIIDYLTRGAGLLLILRC